MKTKKIIAFYDMLIAIIICTPLIIFNAMLFFSQVLVPFFSENFSKLYIGSMAVVVIVIGLIIASFILGTGQCYILLEEMNFSYCLFTTGWRKGSNNIDSKWNQCVKFYDIKNVEIVKLTKEEKQRYVFYRHIRNKYLKVNLTTGKFKYVYIANYSVPQIRKIIQIILTNSQNN